MKTSIRGFFAFCAGFGLDEFDNSPQITKNLYAGVGASIFLTALITSLSVGYAVRIVIDSVWLAIISGVLFGAIIFNLDRFIVVSSRRSLHRSIQTKLWLSLPRILLSLIVSVVIVLPLGLRLFEREIIAKIRIEADTLIEQRKANLDYETEQRRRQIERRNINVDRLFLEAYRERVGTDGTRILGEGAVFRAKIEEAKKAKEDADRSNALDLKAIEDTQGESVRLEQSQSEAGPSADVAKAAGILYRIQVFNEIVVSNTAVKFIFILLAILFIVLTIIPLLLSLLVRSKQEDEIIKELDSIIERHLEVSQEDIERDKEKTRDILGKLQLL